MTLSVNEVVRVEAQITPTGLLRKEFGRTLFVTTDSTVTPQERTLTFPTSESLEAKFAVGGAPYEAGAIYFQQNPYPKNLIVGRWIDSVKSGYVIGGALAASDLALFQAISDGSFKILISLVDDYGSEPTDEWSITGLDFGAATDFSDVASVIGNALSLEVIGEPFTTSVTHSPTEGGFIVALAAVDDTTIAYSGFVTVGASGTDISTLTALTEALAKSRGSSTVVETLEDAMSAIENSDGSFHFVTADYGIEDTTDSDTLSAWIASKAYMYSAGSSDLAVLSENDSVFARLAALAPPRTFGTWSTTEDYKAISAAARMSSVNFNASNSLITLKFKTLEGTLPDATLTPTNALALQNQQVNFYSERSGVPMYEEGYTFKVGTWIDVRYWLDWFVNAVQVEVFNLLYSSPTKVPQTEAGMGAIKDAIELVCDQGVINGGIAGGQLSPALTLDVQQSTGNSEFDGELTAGFLVYADQISTLSQSDRDQRQAPPFKVWLKGSGAIHFVDVLITFEN